MTQLSTFPWANACDGMAPARHRPRWAMAGTETYLQLALGARNVPKSRLVRPGTDQPVCTVCFKAGLLP